MKKEVQKWQNSPDMMTSPIMTPKTELGAILDEDVGGQGHDRRRSVDKIPLLSDQMGGATGIDGGARDVAMPRKVGELPA